MTKNFDSFALATAGFITITASVAHLFKWHTNFSYLWLLFVVPEVIIFIRAVKCKKVAHICSAALLICLFVMLFSDAQLAEKKRVSLTSTQLIDVNLSQIRALKLDELNLPSPLNKNFHANIVVHKTCGDSILTKVESNHPLVLGNVAIFLEKYFPDDGFGAIFIIRNIIFAKIAAILALLFLLCVSTFSHEV